MDLSNEAKSVSAVSELGTGSLWWVKGIPEWLAHIHILILRLWIASLGSDKT